MPRLHLFTVKVEALPLFASERTTSSRDLLDQALHEHLWYRDGWGRSWYLGDLEEIGQRGRHFRIVLVRDDEATDFDEEAAVTIETEQRQVDYSDVVLDLETQVAGISFDRALGYKVETVASRLASLLSQSKAIDPELYRIRVNPVPDTRDFVARVRDADRVTTVTFWFGLPNLPQTESARRGLQSLAAEANGNGGRAVIQGPDLDRQAIADIAAESAQVSEDVSVRVEDADGEGETIHMNRSATRSVDVDEIRTPVAREDALQDLSDAYEAKDV